MSLSKLIPTVLAAVLALGFMAPRAEAQVNNGLVINSVNLTNLQVVDNVLKATGTVTGTIAGLPFTTDINNFALQLVPGGGGAAGDCSVLDLQLAPIHLSLLGLHADTSPICLAITATQGGGLLGDLLCSLAGGGGILGPIIPTGADLTDLSGGLVDILNGSLGQQPTPAQGGGDDSVCTGDCDVLELVLGPLDLSLLGLNVSLDDCDNGPVQVCVSATASEGLLGGLLCGLAGNGGILGNLGVLQQLLDTLNNALGGATLTAKQSTQLINRLSSQLTDRLADGALSTKDLARVTKTVKQVLN